MSELLAIYNSITTEENATVMAEATRVLTASDVTRHVELIEESLGLGENTTSAEITLKIKNILLEFLEFQVSQYDIELNEEYEPNLSFLTSLVEALGRLRVSEDVESITSITVSTELDSVEKLYRLLSLGGKLDELVFFDYIADVSSTLLLRIEEIAKKLPEGVREENARVAVIIKSRIDAVLPLVKPVMVFGEEMPSPAATFISATGLNYAIKPALKLLTNDLDNLSNSEKLIDVALLVAGSNTAEPSRVFEVVSNYLFDEIELMKLGTELGAIRTIFECFTPMEVSDGDNEEE